MAPRNSFLFLEKLSDVSSNHWGVMINVSMKCEDCENVLRGHMTSKSKRGCVLTAFEIPIQHRVFNARFIRHMIQRP